jgi:hypothetical protein
MSSPFAFASNAELTFKVPTATTTVDEWGNTIPVTTDIQIICLLKPETPEAETIEGIDRNSTVMEGFLVDPLTLPEGIKPLTVAIAKIKVSEGIIRTGEFTLLDTIQNPFVMSAKVDLVNRIRGIFKVVN